MAIVCGGRAGYGFLAYITRRNNPTSDRAAGRGYCTRYIGAGGCQRASRRNPKRSVTKCRCPEPNPCAGQKLYSCGAGSSVEPGGWTEIECGNHCGAVGIQYNHVRGIVPELNRAGRDIDVRLAGPGLTDEYVSAGVELYLDRGIVSQQDLCAADVDVALSRTDFPDPNVSGSI